MFGGEAVEGLGGGSLDASSQLREQLRHVFDACDTAGEGEIRLRDLANLSRTHVTGASQVEQILDIFDGGAGEEEDRIDFDAFHSRVVAFLMEGEERVGEMEVQGRRRASTSSQGVFNENLRRSFDKSTSSPARSPGRRGRPRRRGSQTKQSGRIPLVNTSSEEEAEDLEDMEELDDSFDRRIAASLEVARPLEIQAQFLVRGSMARSTTKHARASPAAHRRASLTERRRPPGFSPGVSSTTSDLHRRPAAMDMAAMSPIGARQPRQSSGSLGSPSPMSSSTAASSGRESPEDRRQDTSNTRFVISELERTVEQLQETAVAREERRAEEEDDSPSSGVGSLKVDLEEELATSLHLARRHGEERLLAEVARHREQVSSLERERDLERRNFTLRFQQIQEERDAMKREVEGLQEKVRLIHGEKEGCEERLADLLEEQRCRSPPTAVGESLEEQRRQDREQELVGTVEALSLRVQQQDDAEAELREDNIVLRSQVRSLRGAAGPRVSPFKERNRSFLGLIAPRVEEKARDKAEDIQILYLDPADLRRLLKESRGELQEQREANTSMKEYMGTVLGNIMAENPSMLEKQ